jgi:imidazole glycerol-phosphate synthase subunit HisH
MKTKVDLVDIGIGNIGSVKRCLNRLDIEFNIVGPERLPSGSLPIVLPGVGNFAAIMEALNKNRFNCVLSDLLRSGTPYLGICVGLQVLFESSEESPHSAGLSLLEGQVISFKQGKVPQIGWNLVKSKGIEGYAYFVNSYYVKAKDPKIVSHTANYYGDFCAAIKTKNITAAQFHPEKSGLYGIRFLEEWLSND